VGKIASAP
jgi:hypothetical protein